MNIQINMQCCPVAYFAYIFAEIFKPDLDCTQKFLFRVETLKQQSPGFCKERLTITVISLYLFTYILSNREQRGGLFKNFPSNVDR